MSEIPAPNQQSHPVGTAQASPSTGILGAGRGLFQPLEKHV